MNKSAVVVTQDDDLDISIEGIKDISIDEDNLFKFNQGKGGKTVKRKSPTKKTVAPILNTTESSVSTTKRTKNTPSDAAERDYINSMSSTRSRYPAETQPYSFHDPNTKKVLESFRGKK